MSKRKPSGPMKLVKGAPSPEAEFGAGHASQLSRARVRTLVVTSGKTGVGKSSLAANLAVAFGQRGARVVLVDADLAQAQLDLLLGLHPRFDLGHVIAGEKTLDEVVVQGANGVTLVPGPSTPGTTGELDDFRREALLRSLGIADESADLMIVDTAAGTGRDTLELCRMAHEVIVVASTETMSLPGAYALLKELQKGGALARAPHLVINQTTTSEEADEIAGRMRLFARHFMRLEIDFAGSIPFDLAMPRAERAQEPCVVSHPQSPASVAIRALAARLWKPVPSGPEFEVKSEPSHRLEA